MSQITILKVITTFLIVVLIILTLTYMVLMSRYKLCMRQRADNPMCWNNWQCSNSQFTVNDITAQLTPAGCTMDDLQGDVNACQSAGGNVEQCIATKIYNRLTTQCPQPVYADDTSSSLGAAYATALAELREIAQITT